MKRYASLYLMIGLLLGVNTKAWSVAGYFDVGLDRILSTLSQSNIRVPSAHVLPLTIVRATQANPDLEVVSVAPWHEGIIKVRMRCRKRGVCLPFYVIVDWLALPDGDNNFIEPIGATATRRATLGIGTPQHWLVHKGDRATLMFESSHMRIELPVVCLANGGAGKQIRVATADRKHIYIAEVIGSSVLKGGL